jgi:hypothetical protein
MSDPVTNVEIEDVLSSIRRLVSEESKPSDGRPRAAEKLVLTPSQRVSEPADRSAARQDEAPERPEWHAPAHGTGGGEAAPREEPEAELPPFRARRSGADEAGAKDDRDGTETEAAEPSHLAARGELPWAKAADEGEDGAHPASEDRPGSGPMPGPEHAREASPGGDPVNGDSDRPGAQAWQETLPDPAPEEAPAPEAAAEAAPDPLEQPAWEGSEDPEAPADDMPLVEASAESAARLEATIAALEAAVSRRGGDWDTEDSGLEGLAAEPGEAGAPDAWESVYDARTAPGADRADETTNPEEFLATSGTLEIDEEALRDLVAEIVRQELMGELGERITRNVRKLVRREIQRAIASQDFE